MRKHLIEIRRAELEARIEELIALLDDIDGDADLEETGDDEPSLCGPARYSKGKLEYDLEDDSSDSEPDLGWRNPLALPAIPGWAPTDPELVSVFDGGFQREGQGIGRQLLRQHISDPRRLGLALYKAQ